MSENSIYDFFVNEQSEYQRTSRQYKDSLFRSLFKDKKRFLELYNAIADEGFAEGIDIMQCPTSPIMAMFNDIAFLLGSRLIVMCEHQSSLNPNMPLRFLFYIADILRAYALDKDNIYKSTMVQIPTPEFFVLYNGKDILEKRTMVISDAFIIKNRKFTLELTAKVININYDNSDDEVKRSATLNGYSFLIAEVEKNLRSGLSRDEAIIKVIKTCIELRILADYLKDNFKGVVDMLSIEYDHEAERRAMR